jgi:hypothetical protein
VEDTWLVDGEAEDAADPAPDDVTWPFDDDDAPPDKADDVAHDDDPLLPPGTPPSGVTRRPGTQMPRFWLSQWSVARQSSSELQR